MKIILFGGTGFLGRQLIRSGLFVRDEVIIVSRNPAKPSLEKFPNVEFLQAGTGLKKALLDVMSGHYGIINLAGGKSVSSWPWTSRTKKKILSPRLQVTRLISETVNEAVIKPAFIMQGSGIGYYPFTSDQTITEETSNGEGFLADIVIPWENALVVDPGTKTRLIILRIAPVLGEKEGLLKVYRLPFQFFAGGWFGKGSQGMSWIHQDDFTGAIGFLKQSSDANGIYNLSAPGHVSNKTFMKQLGKAMKRPCWLPLPAPMMRLALGRFAGELMLGSQRVVPERLISSGYHFRFPDLEAALNDLIS